MYDVTIAVTWDEINTNKLVIDQPTCLPSFVTAVHGLELLVLEGMGGKALAIDHLVQSSIILCIIPWFHGWHPKA